MADIIAPGIYTVDLEPSSFPAFDALVDQRLVRVIQSTVHHSGTKAWYKFEVLSEISRESSGLEWSQWLAIIGSLKPANANTTIEQSVEDPSGTGYPIRDTVDEALPKLPDFDELLKKIAILVALSVTAVIVVNLVRK